MASVNDNITLIQGAGLVMHDEQLHDRCVQVRRRARRGCQDLR